MCYSFLNFICEDISFQFEERTLDTLILSSHFVSVFCYILEERIGGLVCVLSRDYYVSVYILYVL